MTGWVTQVVEADGTPVGEPLEVLAGGSHSYGLPDGSQSPNRLTLTTADALPDMRGRFLVDRWSGDRAAAHWWMLTASAPRTLDTAPSRTLTGIDLTGLLARTGLPRPELLAPGRDVADWCDDLLTRYLPQHRPRFRVTDVDASLRAELAYTPGQTLMAATVEPLTAAGMWAWTPQPAGLVTSAPWQPPILRSAVGTFGTDPAHVGFLGAGWDDDPQDAAPPPNEVLAVVRGTSGLPDLVGRWAD